MRTSVPRAFVTLMVACFVFVVCGFGGGAPGVLDVPVIVTSAPAYDPLAALRGAERFPQGAQLLLLRGGKSETLVEGFAATADASVAFDAKTVLFSGKKSAQDPWSLWELTLADRSIRQVSRGTADAVRPLYLPGLRLVFARRTSQGFELVAAGLDGKNELALTYLPGSALPLDVLADGRVLFEAGYPLGSRSTPELYLVYSDGSGVESYRCDHGDARWGGRQLASGDVVFTQGKSLARFTSPLAHEVPIAAPRVEYAGLIAETPAGAWLISARSSAVDHYALKLFKTSAGGEASGTLSAMSTVLMRKDSDLIDPVLIVARERPRQHPSALHDWSYANLLALDARLSRDGAMSAVPAEVRLETLDSAGHVIALGTSSVEPDGSFFVKAPADQPIRFSLLDRKGTTVRQEHGWFWIRRGEQRICVGCHTGPERSAENNVPAVLLRSTTPTDLTGSSVAKGPPQPGKGGR